MTQIKLRVGLEQGLHTRPCSLLVELFQDSDARLIAAKGDASLASMLALMTLGVEYGEIVTIEASQITEEQQSSLKQILQAQ